jgi:hypothetical protein
MLSSHTSASTPRPWRTPRITAWTFIFFLLLIQPFPTNAIKFTLQSYRFPPPKCIWNPVHDNALVIVTANVSPGESQRVDIEIVDSSPDKNVYLRKKDIKGETRLAVTTHAEGEVGVCLRNYMDSGTCLLTTRKSYNQSVFLFCT